MIILFKEKNIWVRHSSHLVIEPGLPVINGRYTFHSSPCPQYAPGFLFLLRFFKICFIHYVLFHIFYSHRCLSDVGVKLIGRQTLSIGHQCDDRKIIIHELGHTIGLFHEQNRPDRNRYIKVIYDNIYPGTMLVIILQDQWKLAWFISSLSDLFDGAYPSNIQYIKMFISYTLRDWMQHREQFLYDSF